MTATATATPMPAFAPVLRPWLLLELDCSGEAIAVPTVAPPDADAAVPVDSYVCAPIGAKFVVLSLTLVLDCFDVSAAALLANGVEEDKANEDVEVGAEEVDIDVSSAGPLLEVVEVVAESVGSLDPAMAFQFASDTAEKVSSVSVPLHLLRRAIVSYHALPGSGRACSVQYGTCAYPPLPQHIHCWFAGSHWIKVVL